MPCKWVGETFSHVREADVYPENHPVPSPGPDELHGWSAVNDYANYKPLDLLDYLKTLRTRGENPNRAPFCFALSA